MQRGPVRAVPRDQAPLFVVTGSIIHVYAVLLHSAGL